jgi:hypothetical protein
MGAASSKGSTSVGAAVWDVLGAQVTAQLLGHVVVDVPAAAAGASAGAGVGSAGGSSMYGQKVLLVLVPEAQLSRVMNNDCSGSSSSSSSAGQGQDAEQQQQQQLCVLTGMAAVTCALVLPTVRQYTCVVLTEAEWQQWAAAGGQRQQAQALQQLVTASVANSWFV